MNMIAQATSCLRQVLEQNHQLVTSAVKQKPHPAIFSYQFSTRQLSATVQLQPAHNVTNADSHTMVHQYGAQDGICITFIHWRKENGPCPTGCVGSVLVDNRCSCSPCWFANMAPRMSLQAIYILTDNIQVKRKGAKHAQARVLLQTVSHLHSYQFKLDKRKPNHIIHNSKIRQIVLLGVKVDPSFCSCLLCIGKFKAVACRRYDVSLSVPRNRQCCQMLPQYLVHLCARNAPPSQLSLDCHRKLSTSISLQFPSPATCHP